MTPLKASLVLKWALYAALAVVMVAVVYSRFFPALVAKGRMAPPLVLWLDSQERLDITEARGAWLVLNFWGTYCGPCRREAPVLNRIHEKLAPKGGRVIGIAVDDLPLLSVTKKARALGMSYPIALASEEDMTRCKVTTIPTTYVLDPKGIIRDATVGMISERRLLRVLKTPFMR
ncbi:MAG: TlpA family protein disulfide reductase [Myxococcales bacterium]|nr:TlpA family protein disulfide reductase [Myxococcales bacterium]